MSLPVEFVRDFPRPPRLEPVPIRLRVSAFGQTIADTYAGYRILETNHPPTYYLPKSDVAVQYLVQNEHTTFCEFKGDAVYFSVSVSGHQIANAAWSYLDPTPQYQNIAGFISFYASNDVQCQVGEEQVIAQSGNFYGGWITANLRGPFKGVPGSRFW